MSDFKPYLINQTKSMHLFQNNFHKEEPSPIKSNSKQLEKHGSPNHQQISLSFSKSIANKPQLETSYIYYLIKQIRQMEQTIEELKQENQILKSQQKFGFLVLESQQLGFIILIEINDKISQFIEVSLISQIRYSIDKNNFYWNIKLKKIMEQMNLMMKIHLAPMNETFSYLAHPENIAIAHKES